MTGKLGAVRRPAIERFADRVVIDNESGCWLWVGGLNGVGYGQFYRGRKRLDETGKTYSHRWSYEYFIGPIPHGLHLDHLCRNRACCNPDHLEAVPIRVNLLRGDSPSALHSKKTHCPAGHPYAGSNLYVHPIKNQRVCRACGRIRARAKRDQMKAA